MSPDRVSNPGPLTYESGTLPTALRGLATDWLIIVHVFVLQVGLSHFHATPLNKERLFRVWLQRAYLLMVCD